jgi:hypothetical protein
MSAALIEAPTATSAGGTTRTRQLRPGRGGGRGLRPVTRSSAGVAAPSLGRPRQVRADPRGCDSHLPDATWSTAGQAASAGWRLTHRGIAVVLIVGALLAVAALTVITATAVTVTSEGYHQHGSALPQR